MQRRTRHAASAVTNVAPRPCVSTGQPREQRRSRVWPLERFGRPHQQAAHRCRRSAPAPGGGRVQCGARPHWDRAARGVACEGQEDPAVPRRPVHGAALPAGSAGVCKVPAYLPIGRSSVAGHAHALERYGSRVPCFRVASSQAPQRPAAGCGQGGLQLLQAEQQLSYPAGRSAAQSCPGAQECLPRSVPGVFATPTAAPPAPRCAACAVLPAATLPA